MSDTATANTSRIRFDPTINMGHILTVGSFAVLAIGGVYLGDYRLSQLEKQVTELKGVVIENAKLGERISDHGKRLDRLETWRDEVGNR